MSDTSFTVDPLDRYALTFDSHHLRQNTFLLGNHGEFVLYLPACRNVHDRTMHPIKWFGASGFGRSFFEGFMIWTEVDGAPVELDRRNQTEIIVHLDGVTRTYQVDGREIRESYFVPDGLQAVVMTLDADLPFVLRPEFDMRYYQTFNTDFSQYRAEEMPQGLMVGNCVANVGPLHTTMEFYGLVGARSGSQEITLLPEKKRFCDKIYLKDERREKLIISVYEETQAQSPDEAPIWDLYGTKVYVPAHFCVQGPVSLICAFGDKREEALDGFEQLQENLPLFRSRKRETIARELERGLLETGNHEADTAYVHVLMRFNEALVARDATLHVDPVHVEHYYAIFAGDKYFMDAWKRDENISLGTLLVTNDYETVREILENTWQHQDGRTGRPCIAVAKAKVRRSLCPK